MFFSVVWVFGFRLCSWNICLLVFEWCVMMWVLCMFCEINWFIQVLVVFLVWKMFSEMFECSVGLGKLFGMMQKLLIFSWCSLVMWWFVFLWLFWGGMQIMWLVMFWVSFWIILLFSLRLVSWFEKWWVLVVVKLLILVQEGVIVVICGIVGWVGVGVVGVVVGVGVVVVVLVLVVVVCVIVGCVCSCDVSLLLLVGSMLSSFGCNCLVRCCGLCCLDVLVLKQLCDILNRIMLFISNS